MCGVYVQYAQFIVYDIAYRLQLFDLVSLSLSNCDSVTAMEFMERNNNNENKIEEKWV